MQILTSVRCCSEQSPARSNGAEAGCGVVAETDAEVIILCRLYTSMSIRSDIALRGDQRSRKYFSFMPRRRRQLRKRLASANSEILHDNAVRQNHALTRVNRVVT